MPGEANGDDDGEDLVGEVEAVIATGSDPHLGESGQAWEWIESLHFSFLIR